MDDTQIKQIEELAMKVSRHTDYSYEYVYSEIIRLAECPLEYDTESNSFKETFSKLEPIFDINILKEDKIKSYGNKYVKRKYRY